MTLHRRRGFHDTLCMVPLALHVQRYGGISTGELAAPRRYVEVSILCRGKRISFFASNILMYTLICFSELQNILQRDAIGVVLLPEA